MLFTDGNPCRIEDLRVFESSINEVASVEGIDLEAKLKVAAEEIGDQLLMYLLQPGSGDPQASARRSMGLTTLVVTPAMRRWHALHTLALIFRDAFHNQVNDRYRENWRHYVSASAEARAVLFRIGLGFVQNPLPRPARPAVVERPGQWPAGSYLVQGAWVNGQGQVSAPSEMAAIALTNGGGIAVTMRTAPAGATGWHVYVGEAGGGDLFQQNLETLALGSSWNSASSSVLPGEMPGNGQFADVYVSVSSRTTPRG
jgi:hypothetical protein